jgi:hypothetical protein
LSEFQLLHNATTRPTESVQVPPLAWRESVGYLSSVTRAKIEAFSAFLKGMSLWEKESLAAEAFLAAERKARKLSRQKAPVKQKRSQV